MKSGLNTKNRLKVKEKAEILTQKNFQKRGNQLKSTGILCKSICYTGSTNGGGGGVGHDHTKCRRALLQGLKFVRFCKIMGHEG